MPNSVIIIVGLVVLATLTLAMLMAKMFRKAGPNEAIIVYGFRGPRVIKGGGAVIFPVVENSRQLSLELMSFDVAPQQDLYTKQGVAVTVEAVAQIKVRSDKESILTAAEQFLTKSPDQREGLIRLVMEGHLRGIIGQLTVEQIVKEPEMVAERMRSTCMDDMSKMGLEVISFTIREVRDKNEYITNMGRPDVARINRDAEIAAAEAERDTAIRRAIALREAAVAKASADQERVIAETASLAKQAEAQRDLDIQKAQFTEAARRQEAQADKAYELQTNVMQQKVVAEQVKIQQIEKEQQVKVQEAEILRHEKELIATVLKGAEIERQRIENIANAEKSRITMEAEGRAAATKLQGEAEANIIFQKGEAEAKAMNVKAEAYQEWTQAAVVDKLITNMADVVRAMAEPLSKVDKITIVSTGNDGATGASKVTGEMTKIAAQVPALFEALSGMNLHDLMANVKAMKPREDGNDAGLNPTPGADSISAPEHHRNKQRRHPMALLERVGTLLRANINDLIEKAEDPEKLAKQLVLDMENQLLQVKTQVAIAIADQHLLQKKLKEHEEAMNQWNRKAELAVQKQQDDLARAALERSLSQQQLAQGFAQQLEDQTAETETLRNAFDRLQQKLQETRATCEMLIAQHRRARTAGKANAARTIAATHQTTVILNRLRSTIQRKEATNTASHMILESESFDDRLATLDREDQIDRLLEDLKSRQPRLI